ncbi:MAG: MMPL family transporter [Helicobacteraceae bacterium]|jgi:predicted RND superfamily exporter protein|nr:MMPL family transporter [Helicobacteraceae bacterium]
MRDYRAAIEAGFARFGFFVADNPVKTIVFSFAIVFAFAFSLPKATIDASTEGFFFPDDPAIVEYNAFRDAYGRDEKAILAIGPADIFTPQTIEKIRRVHKKIEERTPYLDEVTSLINARNTRGEGDTLIVEDLFETMPQTQAEWEALKRRALNNEFYKNLLISEDGRYSAIIVSTLAFASQSDSVDLLSEFDAPQSAQNESADREYLTDAQNSEVVEALRAILKEENSADLPIIMAGSPVITDSLKRSMSKDIQTFMRILLIVVAVVLFIMFRRIGGVIYPLLVSILALLSAMGLMAFLDVSIKIPTQVLPSLLLAVGVGAAVHLIAIFYREIDAGKNRRDAISNAMGHSGLAIVMTALTTMIGIGSFAFARVAPIADLGRFAAFGVFMSLFLTIVALPAALALTPVKARAQNLSPIADRILLKIADFAVSKAKIITIISALLIAVSIALITKLQLSHYPINWFPKNSEVYRSSTLLDKVMKGSASVEVVVDFNQTNALYDPAILLTLDKALSEAQTFESGGYFVGKAFGLSAIVKEINRALNENDGGFYSIPTDRNLIAQELLLFSNSGSDDLEEITDSRFSQTRISHKIPFGDAIKEKPILDRLQAHYKAEFPEANISVTGLIALMVRMMYEAIHSMAFSYVSAIASISVMMILLLASVRLGLLSMLPNLAPILAGMAIMVLLDIPFDLFMMLVGSIIIGLAVDDTIHFMHNFRRYYNEFGDAKEATRRTFLTTGRAMCVTTVVMSCGFFAYLFATMTNIVSFGFIAGVCIILALLADLLLAPALMTLFIKSQKRSLR